LVNFLIVWLFLLPPAILFLVAGRAEGSVNPPTSLSGIAS
jgi:hypothetical protein